MLKTRAHVYVGVFETYTEAL